MSTGQNIIDEVRDILQDATDISFSDAQLIRYINRGAKEFCVTTNSLHDRGSISTDASNFRFSLSTNLTNPIAVISVEYSGTPLNRSYRHEIVDKWGETAGTPTRWYEFGDYVYIDLVAPSSSNSLTLFYTRHPTVLSAVGSTFDFPSEWEQAIVYYAIASCFKTQRDTVLTEENLAKYEAMRQDAFNLNKFVLMGDTA